MTKVRKANAACKRKAGYSTPAYREMYALAEQLERENSSVYGGIVWFACWLLDNVEGEIITEEQLQVWAHEAFKKHKAKEQQ